MLDIIAENYFDIGNLLKGKGNLREAEIAYKRATINYPQNYSYCLNLAEVLEGISDFTQANKFAQIKA
jgi:tetratricopeptide (TPR) repeat protein